MSSRPSSAVAASGATVAIRPLDRTDLERCRELEAHAFGFTPAESLPGWLRLTTDAVGGLTLGAYRGARLVGFSYGLPAFDGHRPFLFSLGLVVAADERGRGIGSQLKLAQRELAIARGYRAIEWTIGSLNTPSLALATSRLGACLTGLFPVALDGVQSHVSMDEVRCRWELHGARRPAAALGAGRPAPPLGACGEHAALFATIARGDGLREPLAVTTSSDRGCAQLVELPWDHGALVRADAALAGRWRTTVRHALDTLFAAGRRGTEVVLDRQARRAWLLFPPAAA